MKQNKTVTEKQKYVEDRMRDAARTLHRLPEERVQGYFSTWPQIKRVRWKLICHQFGIGRTKAWEMYKASLGKIAARI